MPDTHPLDDCDEWECHAQHIAERNSLIEGKRNAEDNFVKTVIQLSSAIALLVPGFVVSKNEGLDEPSWLLLMGLGLIFVSLISGLGEQFLSSLAYGKQIKKTDAYYNKMSADVSPPALSKAVLVALCSTFTSFVGGILIISFAILFGSWR